MARWGFLNSTLPIGCGCKRISPEMKVAPLCTLSCLHNMDKKRRGRALKDLGPGKWNTAKESEF